MASNIDDTSAAIENLQGVIQHELQQVDNLPFGEKRNKLNDLERQLQQLEQRIAKFGNDVRALPPQDREFYESEVKNYRSNHGKMVTELKRKNQALLNDPSFKQNQQLINNNQRANNVIDKLDETIQLGIDSTNTAHSTIEILAEDRDRFQNIDNNLYQVYLQGKTGETTAKRMIKRACFNNCLIWSIVVFLVALLGFSLFWKLRKPSDEDKS